MADFHCNCTPEQRGAVYGLLAVLGLVLAGVLYWRWRHWAANQPGSSFENPVVGAYRITANHLVYDIQTKEIVYRAKSAPEALGWAERMNQPHSSSRRA